MDFKHFNYLWYSFKERVSRRTTMLFDQLALRRYNNTFGYPSFSAAHNGYTSPLAFKLLHKHRLLSKTNSKKGNALHLDYLIPHFYETSKVPIVQYDLIDQYHLTGKDQKPIFTQRLRPRVIQESKHVKLSCQVSGNPPPVITWRKGRTEITSGDPHIDLQSSHGICTLEINQCGTSDVGEYVCRAENTHGYDETSAFVFVERHGKKPRESIDSLQSMQSVDVSYNHDTPPREVRSTQESQPAPKIKKRKMVTFAPRIVEEIQGLTVYEGATIMLQCRVDGKPVPTSRWLFNEKDLPVEFGGSVEIKDDPDCPTLIMRDIRLQMAGEYSCVVSNECGSVCTVADVVIKASTTKPVEPSLQESTHSDEEQPETLTESAIEFDTVESDFEKSNVADECDKIEQAELIEQVEETLDEEGVVETYPISDNVDTELKGDIEEVNVELSDKVDSIKEESNSQSNVLRITKHIQGIVIPEGNPMKLQCEIEEMPGATIDVTWFRNGKVIPDNPDFVREQSSTQVSLEVAEMFIEDSGTFAVKLVSGEYSCGSTCSVIVTGEENKDEFVIEEFPQSVTTTPGNTIDFTCKVITDSPMQALWQHFDSTEQMDEPVDLQDDEKITIKEYDEETRSCGLSIHNVESKDSGTYTLILTCGDSTLNTSFTVQVI